MNPSRCICLHSRYCTTVSIPATLYLHCCSYHWWHDDFFPILLVYWLELHRHSTVVICGLFQLVVGYLSFLWSLVESHGSTQLIYWLLTHAAVQYVKINWGAFDSCNQSRGEGRQWPKRWHLRKTGRQARATQNRALLQLMLPVHIPVHHNCFEMELSLNHQYAAMVMAKIAMHAFFINNFAWICCSSVHSLKYDELLNLSMLRAGSYPMHLLFNSSFIP